MDGSLLCGDWNSGSGLRTLDMIRASTSPLTVSDNVRFSYPRGLASVKVATSSLAEPAISITLINPYFHCESKPCRFSGDGTFTARPHRNNTFLVALFHGETYQYPLFRVLLTAGVLTIGVVTIGRHRH